MKKKEFDLNLTQDSALKNGKKIHMCIDSHWLSDTIISVLI